MDRKLLLKATEIFGSPIYLYDLDKIKSQLIKFNNSFKSISSIKVQYAAKALSNISILKFRYSGVIRPGFGVLKKIRWFLVDLRYF